MLLVGLGLKLKHVKGDEVNGKPKQEEEKEMGKGGGAWPEIDQIVRLCMKVKVRMIRRRKERMHFSWCWFSVELHRYQLRRLQQIGGKLCESIKNERIK